MADTITNNGVRYVKRDDKWYNLYTREEATPQKQVLLEGLWEEAQRNSRESSTRDEMNIRSGINPDRGILFPTTPEPTTLPKASKRPSRLKTEVLSNFRNRVTDMFGYAGERLSEKLGINQKEQEQTNKPESVETSETPTSTSAPVITSKPTESRITSPLELKPPSEMKEIPKEEEKGKLEEDLYRRAASIGGTVFGSDNSKSIDKQLEALKSIDSNIKEMFKIIKEDFQKRKEEEVQEEASRISEKDKVDEAKLGMRVAEKKGGRLFKQFDQNFASRLREDAGWLNLFTDKYNKIGELGGPGGTEVLKDAGSNVFGGLMGGGKAKPPLPAGVTPKPSGFKNFLGRAGRGGLAGLAVGGATYLASEAIDSYGEEEIVPGVDNKNLKTGVDIGGSALTGAAIGSMFGVPGALIGGALGAGYGVYQNWDSLWGSEEEDSKKTSTAPMAKKPVPQATKVDKPAVPSSTAQLAKATEAQKTAQIQQTKKMQEKQISAAQQMVVNNINNYNSSGGGARAVISTTAGYAPSLSLSSLA